ncbi:9 glycosyl hydrolase [Cyathus striatus]|nr:9 glycosyl hydrolase [Cyathus striatus]
MLISLACILLFRFFVPLVLAQLSLPNPPFLPPDPSSGANISSEAFPNAQWITLLGNLLYFYEAQRSGNLPSSNRVSWRNSSLQDDGTDAGVDLSGGYYDAGDYIKATFPLSFSLMSICWGAIDYGKGYDTANQTAYLDGMLRWGLDWLMKAHPNDTSLIVLVGSTEIDNNYWGGDQNIPTPRPVFQVNDTNPGTDATAGAAAAFAACAGLYNNKAFNNNSFSAPAQLKNTSYADTLLTHAQSLYSLASNETHGRKTYQTSVPEVASSYESSGYGDELAMAALFLSWVTDSGSLYQEAEGYWEKYELDSQLRVFNWDSKVPGLPVLFSQVAQSSFVIGGNFTKWQIEAEKYFDDVVGMDGPGALTHGGLLYYDGDSDLASVNPALNAAMLLNRFSNMTSSSEKKIAYQLLQNFAKSQVNYVLGNNSMSMPYVVGSNPNSPTNPHSAMASGGNNITQIDSFPRKLHIRYTAQWSVALDYNAPMLTLTAMYVLNDRSDPFYTSLEAGAYEKVKPRGFPCDAVFREGCAGPQMSTGGKIAMAVVIIIVGLVVFGLLTYYFILVARKGPQGKS